MSRLVLDPSTSRHLVQPLSVAHHLVHSWRFSSGGTPHITRTEKIPSFAKAFVFSVLNRASHKQKIRQSMPCVLNESGYWLSELRASHVLWYSHVAPLTNCACQAKAVAFEALPSIPGNASSRPCRPRCDDIGADPNSSDEGVTSTSDTVQRWGRRTTRP